MPAADPAIVANSGLPASADADSHNFAYFSARSGLTPAKDYAVTSHKIAYFRAQIPSTLTHIDDLLGAWKASGKTYGP